MAAPPPPSPPMDADVLVIGSGFGGSVSALRLVEKGYKVLLLEKGRRLRAADFPRSNWHLRRWLWAPWLGCFGPFKMTFFRHLTALSGVGVGGGSLVYANTLPTPPGRFFKAASWRQQADWQTELAPHYATARRMLGAVVNPTVTRLDSLVRELADDLHRRESYRPTTVAVYFGTPGRTAADPYFGGAGPPRTGCTACGGCMIGCRVGAKNSLDQNYLYLAEQRGLRIQADTEVTWVRPLRHGGYQVSVRQRLGPWPWQRRRRHYYAPQVVFAAGVLGTVPLLLRLQRAAGGLPRLSRQVGQKIRTNSEALIGVIARGMPDMSRGLAIGSIVHTDAHSSLELARYPAGSGFFRTMALPHVGGGPLLLRLWRLGQVMLRHPWQLWRALTVADFAKSSFMVLYMRALEGSMQLKPRLLGGRWRRPCTALDSGLRPSANMPEATALARALAAKVDGYPVSFALETLLNRPTTAHILGGCAMGATAASGVIDAQHRVFNYPGLYVVDGAAISANPGVNPSLTICALAERAMAHVPPKVAAGNLVQAAGRKDP